MEERLQEDRQENHRLPQLLTVTAATAGTLACSPGRACSLLEPFSPALPNMFVAGESCFHAQSCHEGLPCSVTNTCGWLFLCRMEWKGRFCQLLEIVSSAQGPSIFHRLRRIGTHQAVGRSDQGLGNPRPQPFNRQLRRSTNWQQHAGKVPGFARADWDSLHALASAPTARLMPFNVRRFLKPQGLSPSPAKLRKAQRGVDATSQQKQMPDTPSPVSSAAAGAMQADRILTQPSQMLRSAQISGKAAGKTTLPERILTPARLPQHQLQCSIWQSVPERAETAPAPPAQPDSLQGATPQTMPVQSAPRGKSTDYMPSIQEVSNSPACMPRTAGGSATANCSSE